MSGVICYIGIGSNIGNSVKNCEGAIETISRTEGVELTSKSSFYKTEPVGIEDQDSFINAVVEIRTGLKARDLLQSLQNIERKMGRQRIVKGGPRIIDLDLLFYGQNVILEKDLMVPHPELHNRKFVLEPMCEIASFFIHPSFGVSMRGLLERLSDSKSVERISV